MVVCVHVIKWLCLTLYVLTHSFLLVIIKLKNLLMMIPACGLKRQVNKILNAVSSALNTKAC